MSWLAYVGRLFADPPTPEGETHALAERLRLLKTQHARIGLHVEGDIVVGAVMRVNTSSTAAYMKVRGRKVHVPLDAVTALVVYEKGKRWQQQKQAPTWSRTGHGSSASTH